MARVQGSKEGEVGGFKRHFKSRTIRGGKSGGQRAIQINFQISGWVSRGAPWREALVSFDSVLWAHR